MNPNEALGLPKGSVRAIIAMMLIGTVCTLAIRALPVPPELAGLASGAVGFYFGQKIGALERPKA